MIRKAILECYPDISESMRYKMPTYERKNAWVAVASQKNYLSVYFCSEDLIANIKRKYPNLSTGKGCVRIRDNQEVPMSELKRAFIRALQGK